MRSILYVIVSVFFVQLLNGQSLSFGTDTTYKSIVKTTASSTPPHDYFQLYNYSDDAIPMRWRIDSVDTYYPSQWSIAIQDNTAYYNPAPDSADFILPLVAGTMDKIILNLFHNQHPGLGQVHIDLFNTDFPSDMLRVVFDLRITAPVGLPDVSVQYISLFPNPTADNLCIELLNGNPLRAVELFSLTGQRLKSFVWESVLNRRDLDVSDLDAGSYFLLIHSESGIYHSNFVVCR